MTMIAQRPRQATVARYAVPVAGAVVALTGTLGAGLVWAGVRSRTARAAVGSAALLLSIGIGLSRIYLGYHWATDVLAGWTVAVTWLAIVVMTARLTKWLPRAPLRAG